MDNRKTSLILCNQNPTDENILNTFISEDQKNLKPNIIKYLQNNSYPNICKYLQNRYSYFTTYTEVIYCIFHHYIDIGKKCSVCGKPLKFIKFSFGYAKYCCNECSKIGRSKKFSENWHKKYNTPEKIKELTNKIKQTKLEKYGSATYTNIEKCKETWIKNYGVDNPQKSKIIKNKTKQTCMERYGVENGGGSKQALDKIKQTCMERYGVENPWQIESVKSHITNIMLEKYGVENPSQSEIIKKKKQQTYIERYGVNNYTQCESAKKHISKVLSSPAIQQKIFETKKKNHTFNSSKIEQQFKEYLEQNYPNDFEYQYRSELYPFNCDFYIKSLDLYIEIQGSWTHGKHPFDENNQEDIDRLNYMKSKNTKFYNNAIYTWTKLDVKKRNIAKQNNLNYLEIFSIDINLLTKIFENYKDKIKEQENEKEN